MKLKNLKKISVLLCLSMLTCSFSVSAVKFPRNAFEEIEKSILEAAHIALPSAIERNLKENLFKANPCLLEFKKSHYINEAMFLIECQEEILGSLYPFLKNHEKQLCQTEDILFEWRKEKFDKISVLTGDNPSDYFLWMGNKFFDLFSILKSIQYDNPGTCFIVKNLKAVGAKNLPESFDLYLTAEDIIKRLNSLNLQIGVLSTAEPEAQTPPTDCDSDSCSMQENSSESGIFPMESCDMPLLQTPPTDCEIYSCVPQEDFHEPEKFSSAEELSLSQGALLTYNGSSGIRSLEFVPDNFSSDDSAKAEIVKTSPFSADEKDEILEGYEKIKNCVYLGMAGDQKLSGAIQHKALSVISNLESRKEFWQPYLEIGNDPKNNRPERYYLHLAKELNKFLNFLEPNSTLGKMVSEFEATVMNSVKRSNPKAFSHCKKKNPKVHKEKHHKIHKAKKHRIRKF